MTNTMTYENIEFLRNHSECTAYKPFYKAIPCVSLMRK
jgi:hypothetical protein